MTDPSSQDDPSRVKLGGRLFVVLAALMWSSSGFFAEAPTFQGWPGPVLAFWRAAFACVVLFPLVRKPRWSIKLIPMALIFAAMNYTYLTTIVKADATTAIWLQNTAPVWVFLVGVFYFGEASHRRDWWLLAFCMAGVGVILFFQMKINSLEGVIYGLLAGVTYGGVVLSLRQLREFDSAWLIALNHLVTVVILSPFVIYHNVEHGLWPEGWQWLYLAGFGMFQMGLPYVFFARGLRSITGHEASGIVLLEPILVPVWVYLAWSDQPNWSTLVGGALILMGLLLRYAGTTKPRKVITDSTS